MSGRPSVADLRETGFDEVADPQKAFRDLMGAFAEPARWTPLRVPALPSCPPPLDPGAFFVFRTLADPMVTVWVSPALGEVAADSLRWNTGARSGPPGQADYALVVPGDGTRIADFRLGDEEFPERSTLVVVQHPAPSPDDRGALARGPGIRDQAEIALAPGVAAWVDEARALASFPLGIDFLLVRTDGMVCALPRTLEVTWRT